MSVEIDFKDHGKVLIMIAEAQEAESDSRQAVRDAKLFIIKRDGQWDPYAFEKLNGRFRGTFDMCTPIVDQISGEIDQSDFTIKVSPSGGDASMDTAKTLDGLIRNIRNISNAERVFAQASRSNVVGGFDAWEVVQDWIDADSFDQDLMIKPIPNAVDSVWFDLGSVMEDRSDAKWGVKLIKLPMAEYKERWPDGKGQSVSDDRSGEAYFNKAEFVVVGQLYYKKKRDIELVRMTDGTVYKVDDDFEKIQDELAFPTQANPQGIVIELDDEGEEKRRTRKSWRVHSRLFDGSDWLESEEETVFNLIPIIPIYGNFEIFENKSIYFGKLEKLLDQQRVLNYAMSRDIEDGALSPSPSVWMTAQQAEGYDYSEMNTDHDPIRLYNHVEGQPFQPTVIGGPQVSQGLQATIALTKEMIGASANIFLAQQGNAASRQSGVAGLQQINQGNIGLIKWSKALQVAICHTGKVLIDGAIPRVYDAQRQVRILEEDGTSNIVTINKKIVDQQTGEIVNLNDLSIGEYDVVCDVGPAFNSQQKETVQAFIDLAQIDPTIIQTGKDIMLKNLGLPGMSLMAERARTELFNAEVIPEAQWTDEEKQQVQQAQAQAQQQPPQEDPNLIVARAQEGLAQAELQKAANTQVQIQGDQQIKTEELALKNRELDLSVQKFLREKDDKNNVDAAKIQQGDRKLDQSEQKLLIDAQQAQDKLDMQAQAQQFNQAMETVLNRVDILAKQVDSLKGLREAMGVDTIVGPGNTKAFIQQARVVTGAQEGLPKTEPEDVKIPGLDVNRKEKAEAEEET